MAVCALLAPLLSLLDVRQAYVWRIASTISAIPPFLAVLTYPRRRFVATGSPMPKVALLSMAAIFAAA